MIDLVRSVRGCGFRDAVAWLIEFGRPTTQPRGGLGEQVREQAAYADETTNHGMEVSNRCL